MFAWMEIDAAEEVASGYDGVLWEYESFVDVEGHEVLKVWQWLNSIWLNLVWDLINKTFCWNMARNAQETSIFFNNNIVQLF
jgi:hypothetical protein